MFEEMTNASILFEKKNSLPDYSLNSELWSELSML